MAWIYLIIAGILEIIWAVSLKYTDGFTRLRPITLILTVSAMSFYFLALSVRTIPVGTAYAVWTAIGATGVAVVGMVKFDEPITSTRVVCLTFVVAGVAGLKAISR